MQQYCLDCDKMTNHTIEPTGVTCNECNSSDEFIEKVSSIKKDHPVNKITDEEFEATLNKWKF